MDLVDYNLAIKAINRVDQFDWVHAAEHCEELETSVNVVSFCFGYEEYSRWQLESSAAWVIDLKPVIEHGILVKYEIIGWDQVD